MSYKQAKRELRRFVNSHTPNVQISALIALLVLGSILVLSITHAAGSWSAAETENGTVTSPATTVTDTSASASKAIKFGSAAAPAGCTNPAWSSSAAFGTWSTSGYLVNNNIWNTGEAGPQTIYACAYNSWYIVSNQPGSGTDDSVKAYADTQKHVNIPLSTMTTIPTTFDVTTPSGGGAVTPNSKQWNAAFDLWLDNFGTEVMVWNNWTMNWQYWYNNYNGVVANIDGVNYNAYTNGSGGLWFIRQSVTNKGSVDLASVLRWAVNKGWLKNTQVLNEIEYGFEVSYTGTPTTFTLNNYTVTTN
jgi:hypothetical protein